MARRTPPGIWPSIAAPASRAKTGNPASANLPGCSPASPSHRPPRADTTRQARTPFLFGTSSRSFLVETRRLCLSVCLSRRRYVGCKLARCPVSATSRCGRGPRYAPRALCSGRERGSCGRRDRQVRCAPKCNWCRPGERGRDVSYWPMLSKKVFLTGELNFSTPPARLRRADVGAT